MLPWIIATFLLLLSYLGGVIISIILIGSRFEILLLLGFAIVEAAIGFYLWVCIVSLFQVNNSLLTSMHLASPCPIELWCKQSQKSWSVIFC